MEISETIAVLGAGETTGFAMARNMARAGLSVRAWSQAAEKAKPLAEDGVHLASTPTDAARGSGIVVTILTHADAVISAFQDALPGIDATADPHVIWLQMSAIDRVATKQCENLANSNGIGFVDAPVLGSGDRAEQGELEILESGPEEARPRVQQVFDAIGQRTIRVGEAGEGTRRRISLDGKDYPRY